jgi:cytochrome P450
MGYETSIFSTVVIPGRVFVLGLLVFVFLRIVNDTLLRRKEVEIVAAEHDVQAPRYEHASFPFGICKFWCLVRHYQAQTLLDHATKLFRQLGDTYVSRILGMDVVFTCDPENIKHILQRRFDDFDIGPLRRHLFKHVNPDGIFGFDSTEWRTRRKLFRVHFADTRTVVNLNVVECHLQRMMQHIPIDNSGIDIQRLFIALITDTLGELAVGEPLNALSNDHSSQDLQVNRALLFVKDSIAKFGMSRFSSLIGDTLRFRHAGAIIRDYIEAHLKKAIRRNTLLQKSGETSEKAFRYSFIQGSLSDGHSLPVVRDQAVSIYLAGIDSVAALLSATFWFLSQDDRVFQKLRGFVLAQFSTESRPQYDDLNRIPYLRQVLNEGALFKSERPFLFISANFCLL